LACVVAFPFVLVGGLINAILSPKSPQQQQVIVVVSNSK
jgi:hypothetical protein